MLLALALILSQTAPAPGDQEVVITSDMRDEAARARRFVNQISEPLARDVPLARFSDPGCVGSTGIPKAAAQAVVDRISEVAASVRLRVAEPGRAPNLIVAFVEDSRAAVRRLARVGSGAINTQSLADIGRIVDEPGRARAWIEAETRSRDGDRPSYAPNDPTMLRISTSSRLFSPVRRDVVSATVLIDRDAVAGRDLTQVADYAAMRGLTGARLRGRGEADSILTLFTPDGDARAPRGLTRFDRGYLQGLYAGQGNVLPLMKKQHIAWHMASVADEPRAQP